MTQQGANVSLVNVVKDALGCVAVFDYQVKVHIKGVSTPLAYNSLNGLADDVLAVWCVEDGDTVPLAGPQQSVRVKRKGVVCI